MLNKVYKDEIKTAQMEFWSILSDNIRYIQHYESKTTHELDIKTVDYRQHKKMYNRMKKEEGQTLDMDFGKNPNTLKMKFMDMYEGVYVDMVSTNKSDENSDLSTTYLGRTKITRETKVKEEEKFPISGQGYTMGKLLDDTDCEILLDTGATKSYMSKSFYLQCKTLHTLPKFASSRQRIQVGNGQYVSMLFMIPVIVDIHGHRFEIFNPVLEIHENVDLVLGIKNIFELEGVIDLQESCFNFLNRSIPIFQKNRLFSSLGNRNS